MAEQAVLDVPSGQEVMLFDLVLEPETKVARFRFLAPSIGTAGLSFTDMERDFPHLCSAYALPALEANGWEAEKIVISLSDRETPFGETVPNVIQFFEAFAIEEATCLWEPF
ncbi:DUF6497 family protein [Aestuariibius insulae]|uniref:DUF6497 family protein n=1 Tax=Aestuariibius insulae TaxID=2058287 RepID=UPI00345EE7CF